MLIIALLVLDSCKVIDYFLIKQLQNSVTDKKWHMWTSIKVT